MHFIVVVLSFGIASGTVDYKGRATVKDVLNFFKTGEVIALARRSYTRHINDFEPRCMKTVVKEQLENASMLFTQSYLYGKTRVEKNMTAHVFRKPGLDSAPVMVVEPRDSDKDYTNFRLYDFEYYDDREKCAVITFTEKPCNTKCELHVWLKGGSGAYHNCLLEYNYLCGHRKEYNLYNHRDCGF
ncbi:hypothetical protein MTO96_007881 [Rhipicephalus appendiculatus]